MLDGAKPVRKLVSDARQHLLGQPVTSAGWDQSEVRKLFVDEGVLHEQAFILATSDGPVLIWAAELDDPDVASQTFARSTHAIDIEHDRVLRECLAGRIDLEPALNVALEKSVG